MTRFTAQGLLLLAFSPLALSAQEHTTLDPQILDSGVPVRLTTRINFTERVGIVLEGALVPGKKIVEPLYAYEPQTVCGSLSEELQAHLGTAAIVVSSPDPDTDIALFRPTVSAAIEDAKRNWCQGRTDWFFATTYPLRDLGPDSAKARYLSRDLEKIDEALLAFRTEKETSGTVQ